RHVAVEAFVPDVADDADHLAPRPGRDHAQPLADRRLRRPPFPPRETGRHDRDRPRLEMVGPLERAAGDDRRPERLEETRRYDPELALRRVRVLGAFDEKTGARPRLR